MKRLFFGLVMATLVVIVLIRFAAPVETQIAEVQSEQITETEVVVATNAVYHFEVQLNPSVKQ